MNERTVRLANEADVPALKALWMSAFPEDDADDVEAFFAAFFAKCAVPLVCENDVPVSMLFLISQTLRCRSSAIPTAYIYAGATRPDRQGCGLYRSLLTYAEQVAQDNGAEALFLRPASERLAESYRRMGFTVPMCCDCSDAQNDPICTLTDLSCAAYCALRRRLLENAGVTYIDWDESVIAYAQRWCRTVACGEHACALIAEDRVWEYVSVDATVRLPFAAAACRRPGGSTPIGLLKPLGNANFSETAPLYMGYGLE